MSILSKIKTFTAIGLAMLGASACDKTTVDPNPPSNGVKITYNPVVKYGTADVYASNIDAMFNGIIEADGSRTYSFIKFDIQSSNVKGEILLQSSSVESTVALDATKLKVTEGTTTQNGYATSADPADVIAKLTAVSNTNRYYGSVYDTTYNDTKTEMTINRTAINRMNVHLLTGAKLTTLAGANSNLADRFKAMSNDKNPSPFDYTVTGSFDRKYVQPSL